MSEIEALLTEREGYVRRGLKARVAQVDAELKKHGVAVEDAPKIETAAIAAPAERAVKPRPARKG